MDIQLEKKKGIKKQHIPYIVGGGIVLALLLWIVFGNHASTLKVDGRSLNIADVTYGALRLSARGIRLRKVENIETADGLADDGIIE